MPSDTLPTTIVALCAALAVELDAWAVAHRPATLAEHEQGVLASLRRVAGHLLGAVLERAQGLDHPAARRQQASCPSCGTRRRPRQWRTRRPVTVCGVAPLRRPEFRCRPCGTQWAPTDDALGLAAHQALSAGWQAWVVETGAELPYRQAAGQLERRAGIGLGAETVRAHTERVGTALAAAQDAAAATVRATHEAAEPLDPPPVTEVLVAEADGLQVRFLDGWHEVKVGEVAGCRPGMGGDEDGTPRQPPVLRAPSYVATTAAKDGFGGRWLAEAARRGALEGVGWEQPPGTDPRLTGVTGPALAILREVVVLGDGAHWIWDLAAEHFGDRRTEILDYWHATEHVWALGRAVHTPTRDVGDRAGAWAAAWCADLLEHGPSAFLAHLADLPRPSTTEAAEVLRVERGYFTTNAPRMQYPAYRARGLPIGSGAVESAAKHVVQTRMKRAGMRWGTKGGEAVASLCAYRASRRAFDTLVTPPPVAKAA